MFAGLWGGTNPSTRARFRHHVEATVSCILSLCCGRTQTTFEISAKTLSRSASSKCSAAAQRLRSNAKNRDNIRYYVQPAELIRVLAGCLAINLHCASVHRYIIEDHRASIQIWEPRLPKHNAQRETLRGNIYDQTDYVSREGLSILKTRAAAP